ncbi:MAG TPA: ATP-binding cassette domain-containing protein, partial [Solirubrobacteraceae bacterium]|nr:ATP-binding cassette domain-containing protein [Solirubrobacteraceae bacterium]
MNVPPRVRIQTGTVTPETVTGVNGGQSPRKTVREAVFDAQGVSINYGAKRALTGVNLTIYRNLITALIGPSGCGKTTFLRSLNRMNDSIPGFAITGQVLYHG